MIPNHNYIYLSFLFFIFTLSHIDFLYCVQELNLLCGTILSKKKKEGREEVKKKWEVTRE